MRTRTKIVLLVLGVGGVAWGFRERKLASAASGTAHRMTCKDLGEKGPGDNAHVLLTDFMITHEWVYRERGKTWAQVWVPAVPIDSEYVAKIRAAEGDLRDVPVPRPVRVIVTSKDVPDEKALDALGGKDEIDGTVVNVIEKLGDKERKLLEDSYGDVSRAQIFEVGRTPMGGATSLLVIAAGALVALGALASIVRRKKAPPAAARGDAPLPPIGATP